MSEKPNCCQSLAILKTENTVHCISPLQLLLSCIQNLLSSVILSKGKNKNWLCTLLVLHLCTRLWVSSILPPPSFLLLASIRSESLIGNYLTVFHCRCFCNLPPMTHMCMKMSLSVGSEQKLVNRTKQNRKRVVVPISFLI